MRLILMLVALAMVGGCAAQPQPRDTSHDTKTAAAAPAPAASTSPAPSQDGTKEAFKVPSGYRPKVVGATTVYCRRETPLGSRFSQQVCYTQDELEEIQRRAADVRQDKNRASGLCGGDICANTN